MFEKMFENVRQKSPLIHNITNYVTVNDCANMLLACGGSPIMADDPEDAVEITAICNGLNINIGTLNQHTIPSMFAAGKRASELGRPVVLDPVGGWSLHAADGHSSGTAEKGEVYRDPRQHFGDQDPGSGQRHYQGCRR